jgi:hypothetical protein
LSIRIDEQGEKIKLSPIDILLDDEDMRPSEQYGYCKLYQAQLLRSCTTSIKVNAWVRDYGADLQVMCKLHLKTYAHSKVKGFMWLFCRHALPVCTRLQGKVLTAWWKTLGIWHLTAALPRVVP